MKRLNGTPASPGILIAPAFVFKRPQLASIEQKCEVCGRCNWFGNYNSFSDAADLFSDNRAKEELQSFHGGLDKARQQIKQLVEKTGHEKNSGFKGIFESYLEILDDEDLISGISHLILTKTICAAGAIRAYFDAQCKEMNLLEDEYLRDRVHDIEDIGCRLLYATKNIEHVSLDELDDNTIIIAEALSPADTIQLDSSHVAGFIIEHGGHTSHTTIMARTRELPAIVGCHGITHEAANGNIIAFDGNTGEVFIEPEPHIIEAFHQRKASYLTDQAGLYQLSHLPSTTADGRMVKLAANIGKPADAVASLNFNPEGIGLFRSEFLLLDRPELPSEEEQFLAYAEVVRSMHGKPVVLRTFDIGGDKPAKAFPIPHEENPFLGYRGLRIFLDKEKGYQEILRTQLRAAMRSAAEGELWVMFPMISTYEEVLQIKSILSEAEEELRVSNQRYARVKAGIMIETPGAALIADQLAKIVDFFSIGTNDLTQYTLATDRGNKNVSQYYQIFHPAIWRLIAKIIHAGKENGIHVAMCGELASIEEATLPLLGLGLSEFSMNAPALPRIKRIIRAATAIDAENAAHAVLSAKTAEEAHMKASEFMQNALSGRGITQIDILNHRNCNKKGKS